MKSCLQPRAAGLPSQILQPAFSEAGGLHPVQDIACPSPVVMHKPGIPEKRERQRYDRVDEDETGHRGWVPLCEQIVLLIDATAQGEEMKKSIASRMVQGGMGQPGMNYRRFRFVADGGSGEAGGVLRRTRFLALQNLGGNSNAASIRFPDETKRVRNRCYRIARSTGRGGCR
jgi:hypothetical protein